jgi:hypothetical protein
VSEGIDANRAVPPGSGREREKESAREGTDMRGLPVREGWRAGAGWADWADWAELGFFYFSGISNCFFILASLGFSIQIQTKSNMCINSKNILGSA